MTATATRHRAPAGSGRWSRAVRAEASSTLGTRTSRALLLAAAVMAPVAIVANLAATSDLPGPDRGRLTMHASTVATIVFATAAGVLSTTTDYRHGIVDQRLLTDPSRGRFTTVKAVAAAVLGLAYALAGAGTSLLTLTAAVRHTGLDLALDDLEIPRALIGVVATAPLLAEVGAGIGQAVRHQAAALGGWLPGCWSSSRRSSSGHPHSAGGCRARPPSPPPGPPIPISSRKGRPRRSCSGMPCSPWRSVTGAWAAATSDRNRAPARHPAGDDGPGEPSGGAAAAYAPESRR